MANGDDEYEELDSDADEGLDDGEEIDSEACYDQLDMLLDDLSDLRTTITFPQDPESAAVLRERADTLRLIAQACNQVAHSITRTFGEEE